MRPPELACDAPGYALRSPIRHGEPNWFKQALELTNGTT